MGVGPPRALYAALLLATGFAPRSGPRLPADTLTALPAANAPKPLRIAARVDYARSTPAWKRFQSLAGGSWHAMWDLATGVPRRIWGSGIAFPGANADPAIAERAARAMLAQHLALLAPGAATTDLALVTNRLDGDIRTVGFVQSAGGTRVVGGQVSFEFKRDRLVVIGSLALPNVAVVAPRVRLSSAMLGSRATAALRTAVQLPNAPVTAPGAAVILPLLADDTILGYRLVAPVEIDGGALGRYAGYADPASGEIVAVQQLNEFATGTVLYHGVDRWPGKGYVDREVPRAYVTVDGAAETTSQAGGVSWSSDVAASVVTSVVGDFVTVLNNDSTTNPTPSSSATLGISPSGQVVWDASSVPFDDAQVDAYLDANIAKDYVRANLDAQMPTLDDQLTVYTNEQPANCNAYWDGSRLHLLWSGLDANGMCTVTGGCCENSARVQDIAFHEFGHGVHGAEIIPGVGHFDGAMSEGAADFLSASINNDSAIGPGFYFSNVPLREIDPPNIEYKWPDDIHSDIHATGLIYSGALWDMRKAFIAQYGFGPGIALTNKIYVGTLRRSVDIPSSLIEALLEDDDDGNLANGTPHECTIRAAFGAHGLRTASGTIENPGLIAQTTGSIGVSISFAGVSTCPTDQPTVATLVWSPGANGKPESGQTMATPNGLGRFTAQLPLSPEGAVQFSAKLDFADGSRLILPDNLYGHDPGYQLWTGPTVKLYCTGFEDGDPLARGWTTGSTKGDPSTWALTVPGGGTSNPQAAFDGTHIFAQAPMGNYAPHQATFVKTPEIDVGHYTDVHLQYRRWLAVQDNNADQAEITANDMKAWQNYTDTRLGNASDFTQMDKEWRFQDVALSAYFAGSKLVVGWTLQSDSGVEYSGWSLDDVCIVANPAQICGDGVKGPYEQCDRGADNADVPDQCRTNCRLPACGDGLLDSVEECDKGSANANTANTCRTNCKLPFCGDSIVDSGEECDDGPNGSVNKDGSVKCTSTCETGGGCCEAGGRGGGGAAVLAVVVGLVLRRRKQKFAA